MYCINGRMVSSSVSCYIEVFSVFFFFRFSSNHHAAASPFIWNIIFVFVVCVSELYIFCVQNPCVPHHRSFVFLHSLSDPNRIYALDIYCYDYYYGIFGDKFDFGFGRFSLYFVLCLALWFSFFLMTWLVLFVYGANTPFTYSHCYNI